MGYYGHGNCARIPNLDDYDMAKAHYEGVSHIRGRAHDVKPLGKVRRYTWYRITKNTYADQARNMEWNTYACRLYNTDCVEFYPNGDITLRTNGWNSITTKAFIGYVIDAMGSLVSESGKWYFVNRKGQSFLFKGELQLKRDDDGNLVAKEQVQEYKYRVNRKEMNKIRKKYKVFIDYGRTMLAMSNEIPVSQLEDMENKKLGLQGTACTPYYAWQSETAKQNRGKFFALLDQQQESGDIELLYDLATYVAKGAGYYSYKRQAFKCEPQQFVARFDELMKNEFRESIFNAEPVEMGIRFDDKNKKYFLYN
jgi:hypothetical protein